MKYFFFMAVLALLGLSTPTMAQVDTCATTIGDTSAIQALVEAQLEPCATLLEIGTIADSTRPSGQAGWAVKAAFLTCAAQVDSATFFIGKCPSAFSIDNAVLEAPREAHKQIRVTAILYGEIANDRVILQASTNGGESFFDAVWTLSKGDGTQDYNMTWSPPAAGTYVLRIKVTDANGLAGYSNLAQVDVTVDPAIRIASNGSRQPRAYSDGDGLEAGGLPIFDAMGRPVAKTQADGSFPFGLPSGIYYLQGQENGPRMQVVKK